MNASASIAYCLLCCVAAFYATVASAAEHTPQAVLEAHNVAELIREAKADFHEVTDNDVLQARQELATRADVLSSWLDAWGEIGPGWKQFLKWPVLETQLDSDSELDLAKLESVHQQFASDTFGLEEPRFANVRRALHTLLQRQRDLGNAASQQEFHDHLDALAKLVEKDQQLADYDARLEVGTHLGWLAQHKQATWLVAGMRKRYSQPNLVVSVSNRFANEAVTQPVDETIPFHQTVQSITVSGSAHVTGTVTARLVSDDEQGRIEVQFQGEMNASLRGSRGRISVYAVAYATIDSAKQLLVTPTGFVDLEPQSNVYANVRFTGASTGFRRCLDKVVRRLVLRVANRNSTKAAQAAASQGRQSMNAEIDEQAESLLADANATYNDELRNPLLRRDAFPDLSIRTTEDRMFVRLLQADSRQLGAPPAALPSSSDADVSLRLHQSLIDNYAATMYAGRTVTEKELREIWEQFAGTSEEPADAPQDDAVAVTLDEQRPISISLSDGVVSLTVRGKRFIVGSRSYPPMNISLSYELKQSGTGFVATMMGEPQIVPPRFVPGEPNRYSARELALRRILVNRLDRDLKKEFKEESIELPKSMGNLDSLLVAKLQVQDGWLAFELNIPEAVAVE